MLLRKILLTSASLALLACTGILEPRGEGAAEPPPPPPPPPADANANELFTTTVSSLLDPCLGCHGTSGTNTTFLGATVDDHYAAITAGYPTDTLGTTANDSGVYTIPKDVDHFGTKWNQNELDALTAWIDKEYEERQAGGGGGGAVGDPTPDDCGGLSPSDCSLEKFGRCFAVADWQNYKPYEVANASSGQGLCLDCHNDGLGNFFSDGDSNNTFDAWKDPLLVTSLVKADLEGGLTPSYRIRDKGQEGGTHPDYNIDTTAIDSFVTNTLERFGQGPCQDEILP